LCEKSPELNYGPTRSSGYSRLTMTFSEPIVPLLLAIGTLFGALAAASAYLISYSEYRQRMLRPGQNPRRMALETAAVTFGFFFVASIVLSFLLSAVGP
jgi:uncharacterized membrane protein YbhN (UPF0104 family)